MTLFNADSTDMSKIDIIKIQEMVFISNALNNGWSVCKVNNNKYVFTNDNTQTIKEVNLENYLKQFITHNISVDNLRYNKTTRSYSE
jgi:hypothetical protein